MNSLLKEAVNYEYYKDKIGKSMFDKLVGLDPTKDLKYARWIVECFIRTPSLGPVWKMLNDNQRIQKEYEDALQAGTAPLELRQSGPKLYNVSNETLVRFWREDAEKIIHDLNIYTKLKNKKLLQPNEMNILNIKSFNDLWMVINKHEDELNQMEDALDPSEYEKWYEDAGWLVVIPKTHQAACKYGANTRWCTAAKDSSHYFDNYSEQGPLIIIIKKPRQVAMGDEAKGEGGKKWQIHLESDQWMDELDEELKDRMKFFDGLPIPVRSAIFQHTGVFIFRPDKMEYLKKHLYTPNGFAAIKRWLESENFLDAIENVLPGGPNRMQPDITDYIHPKLYTIAYENAVSSGMEIDENSYDYGYNNPWEFLHDQEPELKGEDEGYASDEDPDKWSEDQRRDAAEEAEIKGRSEALHQESKKYDSRWWSRDFDRKYVEDIYDSMLQNTFDMKYYRDETHITAMNLFNLFSKDLQSLGDYLAKVDKARSGHRKWDNPATR